MGTGYQYDGENEVRCNRNRIEMSEHGYAAQNSLSEDSRDLGESEQS
jgi:hypothetical protein